MDCRYFNQDMKINSNVVKQIPDIECMPEDLIFV